MRYCAAEDLHFTASPDDAMAPLEVCRAGTELQSVTRAELTRDEADGLSRISDPKILPPGVRVMPFRWNGKVRFLRLGTQARPVMAPAPAIPAPRGAPGRIPR